MITLDRILLKKKKERHSLLHKELGLKILLISWNKKTSGQLVRSSKSANEFIVAK